jgi:hypothetical protein
MGAIDGVAVDPVRGVLPYAVLLLERNEKLVGASATDAQGKFRFTNLLSGSYKVWAVVPGGRVLVFAGTIQDRPPGTQRD